ncbi:DTX46, partial [Symbiodinium sp. KB8]
ERLGSRVAAADEDSPGTDVKTIDGKKEASSKTEMLRFALPALGIYLANPIMSNIDNSFVGHFGGTTALAALSPGGVLADNLLYLFNSVLSAATTGLVARAWPKGAANAREELIRTFSFALACGVPLSLFYWFCSNWVLGLMGVPQNLQAMAASYARIRGLVSWASLGQGVCLSAILATRDAVTPLRVVVLAALLNVLGDFLLCCWPLRTGVSGAAAATAISTMCGFAFMMRSLQRKQILPTFRRGALRDAGPVLEYAGPMLVINMTRIAGFTAMAFAAAATGTRALAAYQVILGIFVLFAFIGAPWSQTAQSMLPPLIESSNTSGARKVAKNVLTIGTIVSIVASVLCYAALMLGAGTFTADPAVLGEIHGAAFMVCLATGTLLISSSVDGALLAAKDFGFIVTQQVSVVTLQLLVLRTVLHLKLGLPGIWMTLAVRVLLFVPIALTWLGMGYGCSLNCPQASTARLLAVLQHGPTALEALRESEPPALDEEKEERSDAAALAEARSGSLNLGRTEWNQPQSGRSQARLKETGIERAQTDKLLHAKITAAFTDCQTGVFQYSFRSFICTPSCPVN